MVILEPYGNANNLMGSGRPPVYSVIEAMD
jgi:hypothetical protein